MSRRRSRLVAFLVLVGVFLLMPAASAHPLGNFTVNRFSRVVLLPDRVRVDYVIDMAEIPTFQEMPAIDTDGDGAASPTELAAWATAKASSVVKRMDLRIDGVAVDLAAQGAAAQLLPGQGGLNTLRFEGTFAGAAPLQGSLDYQDHNFAGRIGWQEVIAMGAEGAALGTSSVPATSVSQELRSYPQDLLSSPLAVSHDDRDLRPRLQRPGARAHHLGRGELGRPGPPAGGGRPLRRAPGEPRLVAGPARPGGGGGVRRLARTAAGAWQDAHGRLHGRLDVQAAPCGQRGLGRRRDAHGVRPGPGAAGADVGADLPSRGALPVARAAVGTRGPRVWGRTSSSRACRPGDWRARPPPTPARATTTTPRRDAHDRATTATTTVPEVTSTCCPRARPLSSKGILVLALAGGILPAPSALIVLLGAIEAHRVAYGLALVLAFSAGLALALIAVGMGALEGARGSGEPRLSTTMGRVVPLISAGAIVGVGLFLTVRSAVQV